MIRALVLVLNRNRQSNHDHATLPPASSSFSSGENLTDTIPVQQWAPSICEVDDYIFSETMEPKIAPTVDVDGMHA